MITTVNFEGAKSIVRHFSFRFSAVLILAAAVSFLTGCPGKADGGGASSGDAAATVNGKPILMEDVERELKKQSQGQESKLSPLELASARLQVLQNLIQQEVMYQKAEKEDVLPKDEDVTQKINEFKQQSGLSQEAFDAEMKKAGETEASMRQGFKKGLAIDKLVEKITSRVEQPKDGEVEAFFNGNKDLFVKKRGVRLAAIVVDPSDSGEGDTTRTDLEAQARIKEIAAQLGQGAVFETVAREKSEDPSKLQNGELGSFNEDDLKQNYPQLAGFMNPQFAIGKLAGPFNIQGKYYIFKLLERIDKEEAQTLETPGVRQEIIKQLLDARKQLLAASYQAMALNEAKIENLLAKKVVDNPNELSGARPAGADTPAANTNVNSNSNVNGNVKTGANANVNTKTSVNTNIGANTKSAVNTKTAPNTAGKTTPAGNPKAAGNTP
jgi:peptidyl-prolyl cis-trans isomerase SurA